MIYLKVFKMQELYEENIFIFPSFNKSYILLKIQYYPYIRLVIPEAVTSMLVDVDFAIKIVTVIKLITGFFR